MGQKEAHVEGHTKKEVAAITGLTERQVQFYTEQGVITPDVDRGEGRGKSRRYSERNVTQFLVIKSLVDLGMTVSRIREVIEFMDAPAVKKVWERSKKHDGDLVIKIYQGSDGRLQCRWMDSYVDPDAKYTVVDSDEMRSVNMVVAINVSRLDGRIRPERTKKSYEEMERSLKAYLEGREKA